MTVKNFIKYVLQKLLGFRRYLYVFAKYKIRTLRRDSKENDFFHFLNMMKDGKGNILDIGANIGIMTVHLAKEFPNSKILAFEPMPDNRAVFKKVIDKYELKNVDFHEVALGEEPGTAKMILPVQSGTRMQGLSHVKHDSITDWNEGEECEVPMQTLDSVINGTPVQGIKMDVENFEYFVLKGGESIISRDHPVIYTELWENENRDKCFDLLEKHGYSAKVVSGDRLIDFDPDKHPTQNFIFTAK